MSKYFVVLHDAKTPTEQGRSQLKERMIATLRLPAETVDHIFRSAPMTIKKNLDFEAAQRYAQALEGLGAKVEVLEEMDSPTAGSSCLEPKVSSENSLQFESASDEAAVEPEKIEEQTETPEENSLESGLAFVSNEESPEEPSPEPPNTEPPPQTSLAETIETEQPLNRDGMEDLLDDLVHSMDDSQTSTVDESVESGATPATISEDCSLPPSAPAESPESQTAVQATGSGNSLKTLTRIIVATVLLCLAVLVFNPELIPGFDIEDTTPQSLSQEEIGKLLKQQKEIHAKEIVDDAGTKTINWFGENKEGDIEVTVKARTIGGKADDFTLILVSNASRQQSEEDLVAGISRPWLHRFDSDTLHPEEEKTTEESPIQELKGIGRAYIVEGKNRERLVTEVSIFIAQAASEEQLRGTWEIRHGKLEPKPEQQIVAKRNSSRQLVLFARGSFTAAPAAEETPTAKVQEKAGKKKTDKK